VRRAPTTRRARVHRAWECEEDVGWNGQMRRPRILLSIAPTFGAAAGTGKNLLPGNDKFERCAAVWTGDTTSGSHYDVFWTQPTPDLTTGDDIYYSQLYCSNP
jgi:hypothetical protein